MRAKKVKIKTLMLGWHEVSREQALRIARRLFDGMVRMTDAEKVEFLNERVQGTQFTLEELKAVRV